MLPKIKIARLQCWYYNLMHQIHKPKTIPIWKNLLIELFIMLLVVLIIFLFFYYIIDPLVIKFLY